MKNNFDHLGSAGLQQVSSGLWLKQGCFSDPFIKNQQFYTFALFDAEMIDFRGIVALNLTSGKGTYDRSLIILVNLPNLKFKTPKFYLA